MLHEKTIGELDAGDPHVRFEREMVDTGRVRAVPVSAAIANAVYAATGVRCRDLPLSHENVRKARAAIAGSSETARPVRSR